MFTFNLYPGAAHLHETGIGCLIVLDLEYFFLLLVSDLSFSFLLKMKDIAGIIGIAQRLTCVISYEKV